eukprot:comp51583_c0_seq1/m.47675 comp51583_c0_seq1/g.47675  ORF comp51583_c0_seq1/g.47675 comp51583_c0_seq1/m.47675 type:complete len:438 (-) comp51583_c0_seq1:312-1625(-)
MALDAPDVAASPVLAEMQNIVQEKLETPAIDATPSIEEVSSKVEQEPEVAETTSTTEDSQTEGKATENEPTENETPSEKHQLKEEKNAKTVSETHRQPAKVLAGVKLAPAALPWERRLQTLAAMSVMSMIPTCILLFLICLFYPVLWVFTIPYMLYYFYDKAPSRGGRRVKWVRDLKWWVYLRDYFPAQLIRDESCVLDANKNYIFGYHPHGILSIGAITNFMSSASNVGGIFPEVTIHVATLVENFKIPILRELIMAMGAIAVSRKSLEYLFSHPGHGQAALIVIGGASEALDARPKTNNLTLNKRRGFVRLALQQGAGMVPVFCFNENDLFRMAVDGDEGSYLRKIQTKLMKVMGYSIPIFHGRGVFQYTFGFIPVRKPLVTVVGRPVECPKIDNPTEEDVEKYHAMYVANLVEVYNKYKDVHAPQRKQSMVLVN